MSRREESRNSSRGYSRGRETDRRNDHRPRSSQSQHYGRGNSGPSHYPQTQQNYWQDNYSHDSSNKYNYQQQNSSQVGRSNATWQSGGPSGQTQNYNQSWGGYNPQQPWWPNNQFQGFQSHHESRLTVPPSSSSTRSLSSTSQSNWSANVSNPSRAETAGTVLPAVDANPPLGSKEARDKRLQENRDILVQSLKESKGEKSVDTKETHEDPSRHAGTSSPDYNNKCNEKSILKHQKDSVGRPSNKETDRPGATHRRSSLESDNHSSSDTCKVSKPPPPASKRIRSISLSSHLPSKCQSDKQTLDIKQRVIQQLLGMNKNKLKEIVSNPRSRKFEFVMKYMMKESRSQQTQKQRQLAQASIQGTALDASLSQLDYESLLSDPDLAINLSNLPSEMIETLGSIFSMSESIDSNEVLDDMMSLNEDCYGLSEDMPINISPDTFFEKDADDIQVSNQGLDIHPSIPDVATSSNGLQIKPESVDDDVVKVERNIVLTSLSSIADNYGLTEPDSDTQPSTLEDPVQSDQTKVMNTASNSIQIGSPTVAEALDKNIPETILESPSATEVDTVRNIVLDAAEQGSLSKVLEMATENTMSITSMELTQDIPEAVKEFSSSTEVDTVTNITLDAVEQGSLSEVLGEATENKMNITSMEAIQDISETIKESPSSTEVDIVKNIILDAAQQGSLSKVLEEATENTMCITSLEATQDISNIPFEEVARDKQSTPLVEAAQDGSMGIGLPIPVTTKGIFGSPFMEAAQNIFGAIVAVAAPQALGLPLTVEEGKPAMSDEEVDAFSASIIELADPIEVTLKEPEGTSITVQNVSEPGKLVCGTGMTEEITEIGAGLTCTSSTEKLGASNKELSETDFQVCDSATKSFYAFSQASKSSDIVNDTEEMKEHATEDEGAVTDNVACLETLKTADNSPMDIDPELITNPDGNRQVLTMSDPMCVLYESVDLIGVTNRPTIVTKCIDQVEDQDRLAADDNMVEASGTSRPTEPITVSETLDTTCPLEERDQAASLSTRNLRPEDVTNDFILRVKSEKEVNQDYNYDQVTGSIGRHFEMSQAMEVSTQTEAATDLQPTNFASFQAMMKSSCQEKSIRITIDQLKRYFASNLLCSGVTVPESDRPVLMESMQTKLCTRNETRRPIGRQRIRRAGNSKDDTNDIFPLNIADLNFPSDSCELIDDMYDKSMPQESLKTIFQKMTEIDRKIEMYMEIKKRLHEQVARILENEKSQSDSNDGAGTSGVPLCSKKKQPVSKQPAKSSVKPATRGNEKETVTKPIPLRTTKNSTEPSRATSGRLNSQNKLKNVAPISTSKKNIKPSQSKPKVSDTSVPLSRTRTLDMQLSNKTPARVEVVISETTPRSNPKRKKKSIYSSPIKKKKPKRPETKVPVVQLASPAPDLSSPTCIQRSGRGTRSLSASTNNLNTTPKSSPSPAKNLRNSETMAKPSPLPSRKTKAELKEIILEPVYSEPVHASNVESDSPANHSTRSTRRSVCEPLEGLAFPDIRTRAKRRAGDMDTSTSSQDEHAGKDSPTKPAMSLALKSCSVVIEPLKHPAKRQKRVEREAEVEKEAEVIKTTPNAEEDEQISDDEDVTKELDTENQEERPQSCVLTISSDDEDMPLGMVMKHMKTVPPFKILKEELDQLSVSSSDNGTNPSLESRSEDKKAKKSKLKKSKRRSECGDNPDHHSSKYDQLEFVEHDRGIILDIKVVGRFILAASNNGTVFSYSIKSGKLKKKYEGHTGPITCLCVIDSDFESESKYPEKLVTGSHDDYLRCFMLKTGEQIHTPLKVGAAIAIDHNWGTIYIGTSCGEVVKVDTKTFMIVDEHNMKFSSESILEIKATKEGPRRVLIIGTRHQAITVRDADTGLLLRSVSGQQPANSLLLDKGLVYCGTVGGQVPVFDFTCGKEVFRFACGQGVRCMKIYHGLLFAGCYDGVIYVFNIGDQTLVTKLPGTGRMILCMDISKNKIIFSNNNGTFQALNFPPEVLKVLKDAKVK